MLEHFSGRNLDTATPRKTRPHLTVKHRNSLQNPELPRSPTGGPGIPFPGPSSYYFKNSLNPGSSRAILLLLQKLPQSRILLGHPAPLHGYVAQLELLPHQRQISRRFIPKPRNPSVFFHQCRRPLRELLFFLRGAGELLARRRGPVFLMDCLVPGQDGWRGDGRGVICVSWWIDCAGVPGQDGWVDE